MILRFRVGAGEDRKFFFSNQYHQNIVTIVLIICVLPFLWNRFDNGGKASGLRMPHILLSRVGMEDGGGRKT